MHPTHALHEDIKAVPKPKVFHSLAPLYERLRIYLVKSLDLKRQACDPGNMAGLLQNAPESLVSLRPCPYAFLSKLRCFLSTFHCATTEEHTIHVPIGVGMSKYTYSYAAT